MSGMRHKSPLVRSPLVSVHFSAVGETVECPQCGHVYDYEPYKVSEKRGLIARRSMPWCCSMCDYQFAVIVPNRGQA